MSYNPWLRWPWKYTWNKKMLGIPHRDHKKILVIDDKVAFCGGMNVRDNDYAGKELGNGGYHHDIIIDNYYYYLIYLIYSN